MYTRAPRPRPRSRADDRAFCHLIDQGRKRKSMLLSAWTSSPFMVISRKVDGWFFLQIFSRMIPDCHNLSHNRYGNFFRGSRSNSESDGTMQAAQLRFRESFLEETLAPLRLCSLAPQRADIKCRA